MHLDIGVLRNYLESKYSLNTSFLPKEKEKEKEKGKEKEKEKGVGFAAGASKTSKKDLSKFGEEFEQE